MIANVFKIPSRAGIPWHTALRILRHIASVQLREVRKRQAFGSKLDFRPTHVLQWPQVSAHAKVIGNSFPCAKGKIPTARNGRDVRNSATPAAGDLGQILTEPRAATHFRWHP